VNPPKFLIDENLSVALPALAHERGFEAAHVAHRGLREWKDWSLLEVVAEEGWALVTNNAVEFRGRFRRIDLHPGVVFPVSSVPRSGQLELFSAVLADVARDCDLVNIAIDASFDGGDIVIRRYNLP